MGRRKFGYIQQSMLYRSRTDLDQQMTLVLLELCHDLCLCEISSQQVFSSLKKTELNTMGRYKSCMKIRSRSENDTDIAEMML